MGGRGDTQDERDPIHAATRRPSPSPEGKGGANMEEHGGRRYKRTILKIIRGFSEKYWIVIIKSRSNLEGYMQIFGSRLLIAIQIREVYVKFWMRFNLGGFA